MEPITHSQPQLLRRNTRDGKIAGVAAGLGDYLRVDPVVVRLAFVLLVLAGGFGLLIYLVAWIVMPPADPTQEIAPTLERRLPRSRWNLRSLAGGLLIGIGAIAFLAAAGSWWLPNIDVWPLLLIAVGAGLLLLRARGSDPGPPAAPPETAAPETAAPEDDTTADADDSPDEPTAAAAPTDPGTDVVGDTVANTEPSSRASMGEETTQGAYATPLAGGDDPSTLTPVDEAAAPKRRRRAPVAWLTLGALVLAGAVAALLDNLGAVAVSAQTFLLVALAICGVGLVASAFFGRRLALVGLVAVVAAALGVASLPGTVSLTSGAGERLVRPASISELEGSYELGAGKLTLDLRELGPATGETVIAASVGVGELIVLFPASVAGTIAGHATVGEVDLFGRADSGLSVDGSGSVTGAAWPTTVAGPSPFPTLTESRIVVDAEIGIGRLEARRAA